jgi:hypothetical protein
MTPVIIQMWNIALYEDFGNRSESRQFIGEPPHTAAQPPHAVAEHNFKPPIYFSFIYLCL